jgi:acetate kinase
VAGGQNGDGDRGYHHGSLPSFPTPEASARTPGMDTPAPAILTVNAGSSSIKFALFADSERLPRLLTGSISRIGQADALFKLRGVDEARDVSRPVAAPAQPEAIAALLAWLDETRQPLAAIGHRIVHGGPHYSEPQRLDAQVLDDLRQLRALDPGHMPAELTLAEALQRRYPRLPQLLCFDTAFHHDLPRVARLLAIPRRYEAQGVRRYGFHGLSYQFLLGELARVAGPDAAHGRVILAHLGNGASLAALRHGRAVDTSMGFTPSAGLVMGSRSGDLDPGLAGYLARSEGMSAEQFDRMVNFQSGLLGLSETSADMRDLLAREHDDVRAAEAIALFCYQAKKYIGAYAAALGGLDTLVFSGGIGENAPVIRQRICAGLGFLGIELHDQANGENAGLVSAPGAAVAVRVIATDEEAMIARSVRRAFAPTGSSFGSTP